MKPNVQARHYHNILVVDTGITTGTLHFRTVPMFLKEICLYQSMFLNFVMHSRIKLSKTTLPLKSILKTVQKKFAYVS
jgi:hypothetical protein